MNPDNKQFLDSHYPIWAKFSKAGTIRGIGGYEINSMERIMAEEFQPGYRCLDKGCPPCVGDMVKKLYTRYDQWLAQQPVTVAANFPLHDKTT